MRKKRRAILREFSFKKSNYDWALLVVVGLLTLSGLAFLASSLAPQQLVNFHREFLYQLIFGVWIGCVLMYILARTDYHVLFKFKKPILILAFVLLIFLGAIGGFAQATGLRGQDLVDFVNRFDNPIFAPYIANGSVRWVQTPLILIQASELAKIALLVYFCGVLQELGERKDPTITWMDMKRPLYIFGAVAALIIVQPDLGSVLLIYTILFSAMFVGRVPIKILSTVTIAMLAFGLFFALGTPYRRQRVLSVFERNTDASYQIDGVERAIRNGGLTGTGYGNSFAKQQNTILESTTDSIIGVIAEEMGFFVTVVFISLYLVLMYRGLKVGEESPDIGGRALAVGISVWIVTQAFLNIGGNLGIVPLKGLPLPFVSEGGSAIVLNLLSIGVLLNISAQGIKKTGEEKERFKNMRFNKNPLPKKKVFK